MIPTNKFASEFALSIEDARHRLGTDDFKFSSWPQIWSSTSCGFGGVAGQAMTTAQTVVITSNKGDVLVYHRGRYAYTVPLENTNVDVFFEEKRFPGAKEALGKFGWK